MAFTIDDLADQVLKLLNTSPMVTRAARIVGDDAVTFQIGDGTFTLYLSNLFAEVRHLPAEARHRFLVERVALVLEQEVEPRWDEVQPRLRAILRPVTFTGGLGAIARPFVAFVDEFVVIDAPNKLTYVQEHHLERWGVSRDEVHDVARANIPESTPLIPEEGDDAGLWKLECDSGQETSHLIAEGGLASLADHLGGRPVAIMPVPRGVWVGSGDDEVQLRALIETATRLYAAEPRTISPALYTVDGDGDVVPLELDADHPLSDAVYAGHLELASQEYANQKVQLDEQHARDGLTLHVAPLSLISWGGLARYSMCEWRREDSLLPETDLVAIFDERGVSSVLVPWEEVASAAGACWQPWTGTPERVRTRGYPDEATLTALREQAVEIGPR